MKGVTKASRINNAIQVIQHLNEGMSVVDACREVGIPRSSYYYILKNNPEAIAEIQDIISMNNREQLLLILASKNEMLFKLIDTALADTTKPKERLAIYIKLNEMVENFLGELKRESKGEKRAQELLWNGPNLVPGKSRFTATERTVTLETENK